MGSPVVEKVAFNIYMKGAIMIGTSQLVRTQIFSLQILATGVSIHIVVSVIIGCIDKRPGITGFQIQSVPKINKRYTGRKGLHYPVISPFLIVVSDSGIYNPVFMQIMFELKKYVCVHFVTSVKPLVGPCPDYFSEIHTFQVFRIIKCIPIPLHAAKHITFSVSSPIVSIAHTSVKANIEVHPADVLKNSTIRKNEFGAVIGIEVNRVILQCISCGFITYIFVPVGVERRTETHILPRTTVNRLLSGRPSGISRTGTIKSAELLIRVG